MLPSGLDHPEIARCVSSTLLEVVAMFVINLAIHGHTCSVLVQDEGSVHCIATTIFTDRNEGQYCLASASCVR
jgi:hypothetical protein